MRRERSGVSRQTNKLLFSELGIRSEELGVIEIRSLLS